MDLEKEYLNREQKRQRKKFFFATIPVVFLFLLVFIFWLIFRQGPTCFDGKKNGNEIGIDCGGICQSCALKNVSPLEAVSVTVLDSGSGFYDLLMEVRNVNAGYAADFSYKISIVGKLGDKIGEISGKSFVYPKSVRFVLEPKFSFKSGQPARAEAIITKTEWRDSEKKSSEVVSLSGVSGKFLDDASQSGYLEIKGRIGNLLTKSLEKIELIFLVYSKTGNLSAAAKTEISDLKSGEERDFKYVWLNFFPDLRQTDLTRFRVFAETQE